MNYLLELSPAVATIAVILWKANGNAKSIGTLHKRISNFKRDNDKELKCVRSDIHSVSTRLTRVETIINGK